MSLKRPTAGLKALSVVCSRRCLSRVASPPRIPSPTPFVPDAQTFLTLIGRKMSAHTDKISSWDALFTLSSEQLREAGLEPARSRRYLLWWRERFRNGLHGIGGDLKEVKDGVAELRIAEVPSGSLVNVLATVTRSEGMKKVIVNVAPSEDEARSTLIAAPIQLESASQAPQLQGLRIVQGDCISGSGVQLVKGQHGAAQLKVADGLWEQRRGHKVDGGERRKAEVRAKRRAKERKDAR